MSNKLIIETMKYVNDLARKTINIANRQNRGYGFKERYTQYEYGVLGTCEELMKFLENKLIEKDKQSSSNKDKKDMENSNEIRKTYRI